MWSSSFVLWRILESLSRLYRFLDGLFLRFGLAVCVVGGLFVGLVCGWFLLPSGVLFASLIFMILLEAADHAVRRPQDIGIVDGTQMSETERKRLFRFIVIGSVPLAGYMLGGLAASYWLPRGGI